MNQRGHAVPRRHRLVIGAAAEEIDQRRAGVDQRRNRLLVGVRRGSREAVPISSVQRGDLVGEASTVEAFERDRRPKRNKHLADLFEVRTVMRLKGETRPLDGDECAASQVVVELTGSVEHRKHRPDDPRRLGRPR